MIVKYIHKIKIDEKIEWLNFYILIWFGNKTWLFVGFLVREFYKHKLFYEKSIFTIFLVKFFNDTTYLNLYNLWNQMSMDY